MTFEYFLNINFVTYSAHFLNYYAQFFFVLEKMKKKSITNIIVKLITPTHCCRSRLDPIRSGIQNKRSHIK